MMENSIRWVSGHGPIIEITDKVIFLKKFEGGTVLSKDRGLWSVRRLKLQILWQLSDDLYLTEQNLKKPKSLAF